MQKEFNMNNLRTTGFLLFIATLALAAFTSTNAAFKIGVGRADCTGPPVEITFMGYAQLSQKGKGIHLRQYSRAFIIDDNSERVVFVSVDAAMMGHGVKRDVVAELQKKYGNMYNMKNVVLSGTHTHGAPGGFLMYLLYDLPSLGFVHETFRAMVRGITQSIINAHNNVRDGKIYISQTEVDNANINRSPSAYANNPADELAQYAGNTDKTLVQLRFVDRNNDVFGAINWFAVHPTSMNNTNKLVTSDNVGYASILLEKEYNVNSLPGKGDFVGAFASTNLGDVSPNIKGPVCERTGLPCDVLTSSCPTGDGLCFASGPGKNMYESTRIIASRIYEGASGLLKSAGGREVTGSVRSIHQYVDMSSATTQYYNPATNKNETVKGCLPAMGYSFAAGTTDGPGAFEFQQGTTTDNALWNLVRDFIAEPTPDDIECQSPKPILLPTGRAKFPYEWQPKIVPTQVLVIGDVALTAVPGEFTTMSGRRLRKQVQQAAAAVGANNVQVIIAGLSNMYSSYVATPEEYQIQRYEGASTIFGPHTLTLYIEQYKKLVQAALRNESLSAGPQPPYLDDSQLSLTTGVIYDGHPIGSDFGYVKVQPLSTYTAGNVVYAKFIAGNPRNNLMHDKSYFTVEMKNSDGSWTVVATDSNWETKFIWERMSSILGFSDMHFYWEITPNTKPGTYRVQHYGYYKYILGGTYPYNGSTRSFIVQ